MVVLLDNRSGVPSGHRPVPFNSRKNSCIYQRSETTEDIVCISKRAISNGVTGVLCNQQAVLVFFVVPSKRICPLVQLGDVWCKQQERMSRI
jgi:hypothetical protein